MWQPLLKMQDDHFQRNCGLINIYGSSSCLRPEYRWGGKKSHTGNYDEQVHELKMVTIVNNADVYQLLLA